MMKIAKIDGADILTVDENQQLVQKDFSFINENGDVKEYLFTNTLDDSMTVDQLLPCTRRKPTPPGCPPARSR